MAAIRVIIIVMYQNGNTWWILSLVMLSWSLDKFDSKMKLDYLDMMEEFFEVNTELHSLNV